MAHQLGFTRTSTPYQLPQFIVIPDSGGIFLEKYVPTTPKEREDGTYEPVTESIDVVFFGDTLTRMRERINEIETFLRMARERADAGAGVRYYFTFKLSGDTSGTIAEVLSGRVELAGDALTAYGQRQMRARIIVTRKPEWEAASDKEIRLSSYLDSVMSTGGRRITNYRDGTHGNYVTIDTSDVTGVLPTPARISLQNTNGASLGYRNWYIANNVWNDPLNFNQVYEGEGRRSGYGTVVNSGTCSNGQYVELSVNTSTSIIWDITGAQASRCAGLNFRLLMRLASVPPVNTYITPGIWDDSGNVPLTPFRKEISIIPTASRLVDLGELQIPPGLGNTTKQADVALRFDVRSDSSTLLNIDYIQLFPTTSLRHLVQRGNVIPNNDFVVDDGINGMAYSDETDSGGALVKHSIYTQLESPVMLYPGRYQRLYILHDTDANDAPITNQTTVRVYVRPRYLSIYV